jgi:hypothetical protein
MTRLLSIPSSFAIKQRHFSLIDCLQSSRTAVGVTIAHRLDLHLLGWQGLGTSSDWGPVTPACISACRGVSQAAVQSLTFVKESPPPERLLPARRGYRRCVRQAVVALLPYY